MKASKRHIKTFILIFLIALNFVLVVRLWSAASYFGTGFTDVINDIKDSVKKPVLKIFTELSNNDAPKNLENVLRPKRIVLNDSGKRSIINISNDDFNEIYYASSGILSDVASGKIKIKETQMVSQNEYFAALKTKSVLVDFDNKYSGKMFLKMAGVKESDIIDENFSVREYILNFSDNVLNRTSLFVMDYNQGVAYRHSFDLKKSEFDTLIKNHMKKSEAADIPFYSFEINFHIDENSDGSDAKVLFEPLITIGMVPTEQNVVSVKKAEFDINELLKAFGINNVSAGKYKDIDGSENFVAQNADLKISSEGYIEYNSAGEIALSENGNESLTGAYEALVMATEFVTQISEIVSQNDNSSIRLCEDIVKDEKTGSYKIYFDFYKEGIPVLYEDKAANTLNHAVEVELKNGSLIYYKQYVKNYVTEKDKVMSKTMISSADEFISKMSDGKNQIKIEKAYECYVDTKGEQLTADWVFVPSDQKEIYR